MRSPTYHSRLGGHHLAEAESPVWPQRLTLALALTAAIAWQWLRSANPDVAWLLTVNEQVLAGAVPYRDIIEVNPPASILLYLPPVLAGKWLWLRPEIMLGMELSGLMLGVLIWIEAILRLRLRMPAAARCTIVGMAALVTGLLPLAEFAQREHFALLFILPYAFITLARLEGAKFSAAESFAAGLLLGACVAIKPYYAICALLAAIFAMVRQRSWRPLLSIEHWAAAAVALAYLMVSVRVYPFFFSDMLPLLTDLYLPARNDMGVLAVRIMPALALPLAVCFLGRESEGAKRAAVMLLVAAGFLAAYLIQGKGWDNHAYPIIGFCLLAAAFAAQSAGTALIPALLALAIFPAAARFWKPDPGQPVLAAAITQIHPRPKMLALGFAIRMAHPLVRDIGGTYVNSVASLWIGPGAMLMKDRAAGDLPQTARADAYIEAERLTAARDLEAKHPDIVLIERHPAFDFHAWITRSPRFAQAMAQYELIETVGATEIFARKDPQSGK